MISRFQVKNYKALRDIDIPLTPIHVIIGQNDSGKTSLLEAILAFCQSTEPQYTLSGTFIGNWLGNELVSFNAPEPVIQLSAQLQGIYGGDFQDFEYGFRVLFDDQPLRNCTLVSEWLLKDTKDLIPFGNYSKTSVSNRTVSFNHLTEEEQKTKRRPLDMVAAMVGAAHYYRFDAKVMSLPSALDPTKRFRFDADGFGLPTLLDDILGHDEDMFKQLNNDFCEYFPEFKKIRVVTDNASRRDYDISGMSSSSRAPGKAIYFATRSGNEIRAQQASDGALLFLGFLSLLYVPAPPKVLLIEEPEKGVYPKRLAEIVRILKRLVETKGDREVPQIIFTTHSPYVLSEFTPEEVTVMSRVGDSVIARPLRDSPNIEKRLGGGEFYLGELWYNLDEEVLFPEGRSASPH